MSQKQAGIGRDFVRRYANYRPMIKQLLFQGTLNTSEEKAQEIQFVVNRLVSLAVDNSDPSRRQAYLYLNDNRALNLLFNQVGQCCTEENGSYLRVEPVGCPDGALCMSRLTLPGAGHPFGH